MNTKYFVSMYDPFMSNWPNTPTENKKNIMIFECDGKKEAEIVALNAKKRGDQYSIEIHKEKPSFGGHRHYVQNIDKTIYPRWYNPKAEW